MAESFATLQGITSEYLPVRGRLNKPVQNLRKKNAGMPFLDVLLTLPDGTANFTSQKAMRVYSTLIRNVSQNSLPYGIPHQLTHFLPTELSRLTGFITVLSLTAADNPIKYQRAIDAERR